MKKKKFSVLDAILFTFSAVFCIDSFGLVTVYGWSSVIWWIVIGIGFFIPYGLMMAELGTTYSKDGRGVEYWVSKAYGRKSSAFLGYFYWVNVAFWMASVYLILSSTITYAINPNLLENKNYNWIAMGVAIVATWLTIAINFLKIGDAKWFPNVSAIIKFFVVLIMIIVMIIWFSKGQKSATDFDSGKALGPNFRLSLGIIGIIVYNLAGFELNSNLSEEMQNPKKSILKSIFYGGIAILISYILATIPALILVDVNQESYYDDGIYTYAVIHAVDQLSKFGKCFKIFTYIVAVLISLTLLGNMITWTLGANRAACEAGKFGDLPKSFAKSNVNNVPVNVSLYTGLISTIVILIGTLFTYFGSGQLWYIVFSFSMVLFFIPYIFIFASFIKLRKIDLKTKREFSVGPNWFAKILGWWGIIIIIIALITQNFDITLGKEIKIKPYKEVGGWLGILLSFCGNLFTTFIGWLLISKSLREKNKLKKQSNKI